MDLPKAYYCLLHDILIGKLGEYGLGRSSLRALMENFSFGKQRTKVNSSARFQTGMPIVQYIYKRLIILCHRKFLYLQFCRW